MELYTELDRDSYVKEKGVCDNGKRNILLCSCTGYEVHAPSHTVAMTMTQFLSQGLFQFCSNAREEKILPIKDPITFDVEDYF